ncbi:aldo/keto reductase [Nocardia salmonicida]|uniref:aldo/keto reductase n=1 Tax=Nocardia salmonicida TaxID=53431 RepID=UPI0033C786A7
MVASTTFSIGGGRVVCRLGFGTVRLLGPGAWGEPPDSEASRSLLRHVVASGVNFLDTSDAYGPLVAEQLIADALHPYSDELVIATKGGMEPSGPGAWERNGTPRHLRRACEQSLRRLRLDCLDLYQLHAVDPAVPLEDSVGALAQLRERGLIRHVGLCNVDAEQLAAARKVTTIESVQNRFNVIDRQSEPVLEVCESAGIAFLPWFPLGRGTFHKPRGPLAEVARRYGISGAQAALAWLLHRAPNIIAIPGTSSPTHFADNRAALAVCLDASDVAFLSGSACATMTTPSDNAFPSH